MGNLRPAPPELTPMRVDALLSALDHRERAYTIDTLQRLGLPDDVIERLIGFAQRIDRKPLACAGALIGIALDMVEENEARA